MSEIQIERDIDELRQDELTVTAWPIWTCAPSKFPWSYEEEEVCFFLEGEVVVTPEGGESVKMGVGDLVTFPRGMKCEWEVIAPVRKHYIFR